MPIIYIALHERMPSDKPAGLRHLFSDTPTRGVRQPSIPTAIQRAIWRCVRIIYTGAEKFSAVVFCKRRIRVAL
jgi:hypothetical protein